MISKSLVLFLTFTLLTQHGFTNTLNGFPTSNLVTRAGAGGLGDLPLGSGNVPSACSGKDSCGFPTPDCSNAQTMEEVGQCTCSQDSADAFSNCLSCLIPNSNGMLNQTTAQSVMDSYTQSCNDLGVSVSSHTITAGGGGGSGSGIVNRMSFVAAGFAFVSLLALL
ncbi:hypothetical protein VKT23_009940 [Stygiomarasmius scandens]|uniref:Uncharacterized protein n=1 Tax=Marasmiellus scandens TaxID=2682957 RepID=A0ABR1JDK0_9AGAR